MIDFTNTSHRPSGLPDPKTRPDYYQGVPLRRFLAWIFDTILSGCLSAFIVPFTAFTGLFFFPALMFVVGFIYRWLMLSRGSATLGMMVVGIELRQRDGRRLSNETALLHTIGFTLSWAMPIVQLVSVILMGASARGQGVSDMVLGTTAINRPL